MNHAELEHGLVELNTQLDECASAAHSDGGLSLADGVAGIALIVGELAAQIDRRDELDRAATIVCDFLSRIVPGSEAAGGLFMGVTGLAFADCALSEVAGKAIELSLHAEVIERITAEVDDLVSTRSFDLVSGLTGVGVYLLRARGVPGRHEALGKVVRGLRALASEDSEGARWETSRERVPEVKRAYHPQGYTDLGMAHGTCGVIAFLSRCELEGIAEVTSLLNAAERYIHLVAVVDGRIPTWIDRVSGERSFGRASWCYGAEGILAGLLQRDAARSSLLDIGARSSRDVRIDWPSISSPGLCHGVTGLALLCHRLPGVSVGQRDAGAEAAALRVRELIHSVRSTAGLLEGLAGFLGALGALHCNSITKWEEVLLIPPASDSVIEGSVI